MSKALGSLLQTMAGVLMAGLLSSVVYLGDVSIERGYAITELKKEMKELQSAVRNLNERYRRNHMRD